MQEPQDLSPASEPASEPAPDLVVGVGASAGGLGALERLFEPMPAGLGCAFVVVQHLSPDFRSHLDELLGRRTVLSVQRAEDGTRLRRDTIYIAPPGKEILLSGGRLLLSEMEASGSTGHLIDHFLRSLAHDAGPRGVALILSGTGSDGTKGLRDVQAAGGAVLVQSPASAEFDGMPRSAVETGLAARVLPPEEMVEALRELLREAYEAPPPRGETTPILERLMEAFGLDFSQYKPASLQRRIERRVELTQSKSLRSYIELLDRSREELAQLYQDLLISVTQFFRDPEAFERLGKEIFPELLRGLPAGEDLRVWVAGCSTGEEAYSVAMVLTEAMEAHGQRVTARIFATDVQAKALKIASVGLYPESALEGVSEERRSRFFQERNGHFSVTPELRSMVVFAPHNLLRDAPFTRLDLITCRNLLIYLQPHAQRKAVGLFQFGLKPRGILFLGPSETIADLGQEFETLDGRWKLFRKRQEPGIAREIRPPRSLLLPRSKAAVLAPSPPDPGLLGVYDGLLDDLCPPSFLINAQRELLHTFGGAGKYLRVRDGRMSGDLVDLLDGELRIAVVGALQRAQAELVPARSQGVVARSHEGERVVQVTARPARSRRSGELFFLILLDEKVAAPLATGEGAPLSTASLAQIEALESELRYTKESLQATIEELVTSNEQLQSTNEEMVAANEELQTTNQELHSVNEELHTINSEYQRSITELTDLNLDMDHLLASTEIHTLFLDRNLHIRRFTARLTELFHLIPQDAGRRIDTFHHGLRRPGLVEALRRVAGGGEPVEEHVQDEQGRWYLLRILPHRRGGSADGVVLTLVDTTRLRRAEEEASRKQAQLSGILKNLPHRVFVTDREGRYVLSNRMFQEFAGGDPSGKCAEEIFSPELASLLKENDERVLRDGTTVEGEVTLPDPQGPRTFLCVKFPLREPDGMIAGVGTIQTDVTGLKRAEQEAHRAVAQRDRFLATLSHELRNPLSAILNAARVLGRASEGKEDPWREIILEGAQHMGKLLEDLLDVARITQDKLVVERAPMDLVGCLRRALDGIRLQCSGKELSLIERLPPGQVVIQGDVSRVQQAIGNVLSNAVRYGKSGGIVEVTLDTSGGEALLRVRDDGVGMNPETLARIFEPFFQGHAPGSRGRDSGMGIGLALVRRIVELHEGAVEASSGGEGQGSEFLLRFPLRDAPLKRPSLLPEPPSGLRVLLVEDDAHNRAGLSKLLEMDGLRVIAVGSGEEALEVVEEAQPEVILLDIGLPGIDGHETCRRLRRLPAGEQAAILALTGFGQQSDREATRVVGFDGHVVKPIDLDDLYRVLQGVIKAGGAKGT
jgi:two-component system CheB/CheR fusion protein